MTVEIRRLSIPEFSVHCPAFVDIYLTAMGYSPSLRNRQIENWRRDTSRPAFTALCAIEQDFIIGVAYGFLGTPDHWWYRQLEHGLAHHSPPITHYRNILSSFFEVAELHVAPSRQSRGVGRMLISQLLHHVPADYAVLSTPEVPQESNAAFHLYRSLGFQDLLRNYYFSGDSRPFAVLYSALPVNSSIVSNGR
ncbi:GNAT family N-acetyltransferase [Corynebacterium poyangense]|uniref:GNAT family N-acetyltransferase n=1 Tax=Corynebacterium poyangense TaxID=2684405 RepID=A0A7H0SPU5_9CORY|nr:GNAT family N-acetyltransferase [Corynebacterium poyangense]MBZ8178159.1 GNAT family N-acetyltransferase [Corynebacterium poyangense]QNQ90570.1 GNAT family N-acetyltransferase [Corynebacterium poyangense]